MTTSRIHIVMAALMGAAGVGLWAMAAHRPGASALVTAAQFLLFHSPAIIAITVSRKQGLVANRVASIAIAMLVLGNVLFAGDIVTRSFSGQALFAMAAPVGGSATILGWLAVALSAMLAMNNNDRSHH